MPPAILAGRYEVLRPLGHGGMGDVLLVRDLREEREVALKRLHLADEEAATRFRDEFATLARIEHPNIVRVFDYGVLPAAEGGGAYFTMESLEGKPIDEAIGPGDLGALLGAVLDIAAGLDALGGAGIVHCDLKPSNVMLVGAAAPAGGRVRGAVARLLDFGLAGRLGRPGLDPANVGTSEGTDRAGLTRIRGTAGFVSPEVMAGGPYTPASDAFALGATLYRVASGRPAFPGRTTGEILASLARGRPSSLPLRAVGVPAAMETALVGMLDPEPGPRLKHWQELRNLARAHAGGTSGPLSSHPDVGARGPLIGREDERRRIRSHFDRHPVALAVISGPVGSGRTRLAREIAVDAELDGWQVVWLDRSTSSASFRADLPSTTKSSRILVVLDDVDEWSTDALKSIDLTGMESPIALVATVDANSPSDGWTGVSLALSEDPVRRDVHIEGLTDQQVARLIEARLGSEAPTALPALLDRKVGILPGPLHLALDQLLAHKALVESDGFWVLEPEAESLLGKKVVSEAGLAIRGLDAHACDVMLELTTTEVPMQLDDDLARELSWRGLVEHQQAGWVPKTKGLSDEVRLMLLPAAGPHRLEHLFASVEAAKHLSASRRSRILGEVALASRGPSAAIQHFIESIRSDDEAGEPDASICLYRILDHTDHWSPEVQTALLALSRQLSERGEDQWSVNLLDAILRVPSPLDPSLHVRIAYQRARSFDRLGEYEKALDAMDSASTDLDASDFDMGEWWSQRALSLQYLGRHTESIESYQRAADATQISDGAARARILNRHAMQVYLNLDPEQGRALLQEAFHEATRANAEFVIGTIQVNQGLVALREGRLSESRDRFRQAADYFEEMDRIDLVATSLVNWASAASASGEWTEFEPIVARVTLLARQQRNPHLLLNILATRMSAALRRGDLAEASRIHKAESSWLKAVKRKEAQLHYRITSAELARLRGRDRAAKRHLVCAMKLSRDRLSPRYESLTELGLGVIAARHGRVGDARIRLIRAIELQPADSQILRQANLELVRLITDGAVLPSPTEAFAILETVATESAEHDGVRAEASAWRTFEAGRYDEAIECFTAAAKAYADHGLQTAFVEMNRLAGLALAQAGRGNAARQFLREGHGRARRLGMRSWARRMAEEILEIERTFNLQGERSVSPERETLYRVSEVLNSEFEPTTLLPRALALVCERIGAERGFILLSSDAGEPRPAAQYGHVDDESRTSALEVSRTVIRRVTSSGEPFRTDDAASDPRLGSTLSILDMSVRSLLCVPLRLGDELVGTIYAENRSSAGQFDEEQVDLVEAFANLVAVAIQNARLHEELKRSRDRVVGENLSLRREVETRYRPTNIIGQSAVIERILGEIERVAQSRATVLITGESGTGKDLVAKTIHFASPRSQRPFLSLNCAALPADLIESELFGIEARVATGVDRRMGIFERADGGTLFLDEIGDMPLDLQAKLLRVLQEREFTRIGGSTVIRVDVRLVAATNQDLQQLIREKRFREDLFFRIHTLPLHLPPLRERKVDIPLLAQHFLRRFCEENALPVPRMPAAFTEMLLRREWPGNVRELQNYIERCVVMSRGAVLEAVGPGDGDSAGSSRPDAVASRPLGPAANLKAASRDAERKWIEGALQESGGNQRRAAALLGIPEPTLRYRMGRLGVSRPAPKPSPAGRRTSKSQDSAQ